MTNDTRDVTTARSTVVTRAAETVERCTPALLDLMNLLPRGELAQVIAALEMMLRPGSQRDLDAVLALIATAWPFSHQKTDQTTLDLFARQLADDLSQFPSDILVETVREVRRTLRFMPSIAELFQPATARLAERRALHSLAQRQLRRYRQRDEPAPEAREQREIEAASAPIAAHGASTMTGVVG